MQLTSARTPSISSQQTLLPHTLREIEFACCIADLKEQNCNLKSQQDAASVHAILTAQELSIIKHQYNKKTKKKDGSRCIITDARILMSHEGKEQAAADAAKKEAKKKAEVQRQEKQKEAECADIIRRADHTPSSPVFIICKRPNNIINFSFEL
ncbi:hypothetical protein GYMLUDRAFT_244377 [Collybiopsis luxurians FD-317 M1]|uniref:Uncharacterized protein n=1 Tax=Collybiopsis luxurians FD-317 M1 TaxID=944289 RepID=A0A0D0CNN2_9AGAR|nr:hypothetical protein GYMLUDRAFT_244377 [Collybiopsis luxurians FD-317 M1]